MKKTYIAPKFAVVELEAESIIAGSQRMSVDNNTTADTDSEVGVGGSRSTLWGED